MCRVLCGLNKKVRRGDEARSVAYHPPVGDPRMMKDDVELTEAIGPGACSSVFTTTSGSHGGVGSNYW